MIKYRVKSFSLKENRTGVFVENDNRFDDVLEAKKFFNELVENGSHAVSLTEEVFKDPNETGGVFDTSALLYGNTLRLYWAGKKEIWSE